MELMFWVLFARIFLCWLFLPIPGNAKGPERVVSLSVHADISSPFKLSKARKKSNLKIDFCFC